MCMRPLDYRDSVHAECVRVMESGLVTWTRTQSGEEMICRTMLNYLGR